MSTNSNETEPHLSSLPFIKAHGTENDFVVLIDVDDQLESLGVLTDDLVAALCDRRAGIGGDGFLRVVRADAGRADAAGDNADAVSAEAAGADSSADGAQGAGAARWFMDYRNADGSIAEMCGNGIRVFAHVLASQGLETEREFDVDTRAGVKHIVLHELEGDSPHGPSRAVVQVGMGPVEVTGVSTARMGEFDFAGLGVDMGNPHLAAVIPGLTPSELAAMDFTQPAFDHDFFPHGVNVEVLTEMTDDTVHMRVWERGVGETRSCGTGTVAAARAALADAGIENGTVTVRVPGGALTITITDNEATMTGPSVIVARGEVNLNALR
ncbi:diaminopimelate epimerase [Corynebacterium urinipleomorphum]|uniref:diaminopimelate epimerase n=1 Tax=Corynebacterium urinipleomorphum TaxID=1852380 RepID=UPI001F1AC619|nr:diaminopimelate epimerase [Corynebacterium urinipleomorphum]